MLESFGFVYETNIILHIISKLKLKQTSYFFHYPIDLSSTRGGSTDPFQTPSVVAVFNTLDHPPPHLSSMVVSIFEFQNLTPPHLYTNVVSESDKFSKIPPLFYSKNIKNRVLCSGDSLS